MSTAEPPTAAIAVICKTPGAGASKTRLRPLIGTEGATELAACFVRDTTAAIAAVPAAALVSGHAIFAPAGSEALLRPLLPPGFGLVLQESPDFGANLHGGAAALLAQGHDCALVVNSDSPTLPPVLLAAAVAALRAPGDRVVLGPATDGGYYLIGLKHPHRRLFEQVRWSTPEVLPTTLARAAEIGLPVTLLPEWYDVDDAATFAVLEAELAGTRPAFAAPGLSGGPAEATRAFLAGPGAPLRAAALRPQAVSG